ncbi:PepSY-associated TM helix domain-containing protein [Thalassobellus citreus]|uniref:PepSY-associated TM helix domain-containing protein n=1 Tax=Thalassobellus citreus TaxID=3367752 RepID=UPI0037AD7B48
MKKYTFRKLINDLHLWLGIGSGIVLFIVCLTGTILAFETEISSWSNKDLYYSEKEGSVKSFETIINSIESNNVIVKEFIFYGEENKNPRFTVVTKAELESKKRTRGRFVYVNPYTGKEVSSKGKTNDFLHSIEQLHRFLLLDKKIGRPIVGVCTIIFVFLCLSGLILWFPKKLKQFKKWKVWKQGFSIKTKASWKRVNYDIHNTLGFYALFPLLLMSLTGLLWSFTWYYDGLEKILGDKLGKSRFDKTVMVKPVPSSVSDKAILNLSRLLQKTDSILDYPNFATRVTLPLSSNKSVMIRKIDGSLLAYNAADKLQFNPYTNALISKTLFQDEKFGSKIAGLIRGIHVGNFAGLITKIIYFICCLIATSLPVTGTLIWINKMKKNKQK